MCMSVGIFSESRDQDGAVKGDMVPVVIWDTECIRGRLEDRGDPVLTRDTCENATLVFRWLHHQRALSHRQKDNQGTKEGMTQQFNEGVTDGPGEVECWHYKYKLCQHFENNSKTLK